MKNNKDLQTVGADNLGEKKIENGGENFENNDKNFLEGGKKNFNEQKNFVNGAIKISEEIGDTKSKIKKTEVLKNGLRIENLRGNELSPEEIKEISDFYLEIFRNEPYSQFLLKKDDPLNPISPQEFFGSDKKYFSLEETELDELPEGYAYWMERDKVEEVTNMRMNENTYVTRMFDEKTGKLVGLVYGRRAILKEIFETEEMKNPLFLSDYFDENLLADEDEFYGKMKEECGLEKNKNLFFVSCMAVHPDRRNSFDNFFKLVKNFLLYPSKDDLSLCFVSEIEDDGAAHDIIMSAGDKKILGVLGNNHSIVFTNSLYNFSKPFVGDKKDLLKCIKEYKKNG